MFLRRFEKHKIHNLIPIHNSKLKFVKYLHDFVVHIFIKMLLILKHV